MFPTDPNAPDGPDRSEYVRRDYDASHGRVGRVLRLLRSAEPRSTRPSDWPPVRQLTPLGSEPDRGSARSAA
jgi:hypothetical protein